MSLFLIYKSWDGIGWFTCTLRNGIPSLPSFLIPCKALFLALGYLFSSRVPFGGSRPNAKWIIWVFEKPNNLAYFLHGCIWSLLCRFILNANSRHKYCFSFLREGFSNGNPANCSVILQSLTFLKMIMAANQSKPQRLSVCGYECARRARGLAWRLHESTQKYPWRRLEALRPHWFPRSRGCLPCLITLPATPDFISTLCLGPSDLWHWGSSNLLQADFPRRLESPFKRHQNHYKSCSTSKIQGGEPHPLSTDCIFLLHCFLSFFFFSKLCLWECKLIAFLNENLTFITKTLKYCICIDPTMPSLYI